MTSVLDAIKNSQSQPPSIDTNILNTDIEIQNFSNTIYFESVNFTNNPESLDEINFTINNKTDMRWNISNNSNIRIKINRNERYILAFRIKSDINKRRCILFEYDLTESDLNSDLISSFKIKGDQIIGSIKDNVNDLSRIITGPSFDPNIISSDDMHSYQHYVNIIKPPLLTLSESQNGYKLFYMDKYKLDCHASGLDYIKYGIYKKNYRYVSDVYQKNNTFGKLNLIGNKESNRYTTLKAMGVSRDENTIRNDISNGDLAPYNTLFFNEDFTSIILDLSTNNLNDIFKLSDSSAILGQDISNILLWNDIINVKNGNIVDSDFSNYDFSNVNLRDIRTNTIKIIIADFDHDSGKILREEILGYFDIIDSDIKTNYLVETRHGIKGTQANVLSIINSNLYDEIIEHGEVGTVSFKMNQYNNGEINANFDTNNTYIPPNKSDKNNCIYSIRRTEYTKIEIYKDSFGNPKANIKNLDIFHSEMNDTIDFNIINSNFWNKQMPGPKPGKSNGFIFAPESNDPYKSDEDRGLNKISKDTRNMHFCAHGIIDLIGINLDKTFDRMSDNDGYIDDNLIHGFDDCKIKFHIINEARERKEMYLKMGFHPILGGYNNDDTSVIPGFRDKLDEFFSNDEYDKESFLNERVANYHLPYKHYSTDIKPNNIPDRIDNGSLRIQNGSLIWLRSNHIDYSKNLSKSPEYFYLSGVYRKRNETIHIETAIKNNPESIKKKEENIRFVTKNNNYQYTFGFDQAISFDLSYDFYKLRKSFRVHPWYVEFCSQGYPSSQEEDVLKDGIRYNGIDNSPYFNGMQIRLYTTYYDINSKTFKKICR